MECLLKERISGKSNITRIKNALRDRELIEMDKNNVYIEDPVFRIWFNREYNR